MTPFVDILIPTYSRPAALAVTLSGLVAQTFRDFRVIVSDQTDRYDVQDVGEVQAVINVLGMRGIAVTVLKNLPRQGMAQQRQFLLKQVRAPYALFLDDDVLMESYVLENMVRAIQEERCGLVGSALIGPSYLDDVRPDEQQIAFWDTPVTPEDVRPGQPGWDRYRLHNAANIHHVAEQLGLTPDHPRKYKISWVGGCVLFDVEKLRSAGSFSFWKDLPSEHVGEDVLVQLRVISQYGGCGLIPSGVYHLQLPTTIPNRTVDAPRFLEI